MTSHLNDVELRAFVSGTLSPDDLLQADDHLAQCDRCRGAAAALSDVSGRIDGLLAQLNNATEHLSDGDLVLLAQGRLPPDAREPSWQHLKECATCAAEVDDLRQWAVQPRARRGWSRFAVAAAVLLVILLPAAIWEARSRHSVVVPASLAGVDTLPPNEQARVRSALETGTLPLPPFVNEITLARETLMGPTPTPAGTFELLAPVGTGTVSDRPEFRWQPLGQADAYVVTIFDEQSNIVARSPATAQTSWAPPNPLTRDRTYVWQVSAHRGGETTTVPIPPRPPAKFHVVDAGSADMLQRLERDHPQSDLLLGILFAEAGVVDAAATHLRHVPSTDANSAAVRRLLDGLRR